MGQKTPMLIAKMIGFLENRLDAALDGLPLEASHATVEHEAEYVVPMIVALTHLYALKQASVRMARQQKLLDDVKSESTDAEPLN